MTAKVYVFACGCIRRDDKDTGPIEYDCGDPNCYRRTWRTKTVQANRATRRAKGKG